jgi:ParB family chromosome partitioning protein
MSAHKRGLGRGLGALLGDVPAPAADRGDVRAIAIDAIRPNPQQPRKHFDQTALAELAESIKELGVLVPIIVRAAATPGHFELIAGERRWRASALAHRPTIPALVKTVDDRASLEIAIVENLQRADLDPLEEAMGFAHLVEDYGFTQERVAERIGRSRPSVANAMRLLSLSDKIKAKLKNHTISVGHARALLAFPPERREALAERVERDGWTVRDLEREAQRENGARPERAKPRALPAANAPDIVAVENRLRYALAAPVAIVPGGRGGRLEIRYADDADLARIVETLLPEDR